MIAIVVPTIRQENFINFMVKWADLFVKHKVNLYKVCDGEFPVVQIFKWGEKNNQKGLFIVDTQTINDVMGEYSDLIYNFNDGVRNLGFACAYKDGADIIITLDDDTEPVGDPIQDHIDALNTKHSTSWINTANEVYMRGFPYGLREESECVLSHGVWKGVADFDASTQLVLGSPELTYKRMAVPKGILFPMCIMNVAFKCKMTPYMYQAPMFGDINRFADIWGGIEAKKDIDANGWCAVTGYAIVKHERASNPFTNLVKEARGVGMNEKYGEDEYFKLFISKRERWQEYLRELL